MDLVLARKKLKTKTFGEEVADFAAAQLHGSVIEQDQNAAFAPQIIEVLRGSGLLAIELGRYSSVQGARGIAPAEGTFSDVVAAIRTLSRTDPSVAVLVHVHNALVCRLISKFGTEGQKSGWLPKLAGGCIGAFAATEAHAGSDLQDLRAAASKTADGYRLTGEKHWITNAKEAGIFIVFAKLDGDGMAAFLVPADSAGVTIGRRLMKMSVRASSTCTVTFDGVRLPPEALLGGPRMGLDIAMYGLVCGRIGIAAQMLGIAEGALRLALDYASERYAFGDRIINYQGVAFPLAQASTEIAAAALMVEDAASQLSAGRPHMIVSELANKSKLFASQVAERVTSACVEVLGGNGVCEDFRVERFFRDAKVGKIYEGTTNVLLRSIAQTMVE